MRGWASSSAEERQIVVECRDDLELQAEEKRRPVSRQHFVDQLERWESLLSTSSRLRRCYMLEMEKHLKTQSGRRSRTGGGEHGLIERRRIYFAEIREACEQHRKRASEYEGAASVLSWCGRRAGDRSSFYARARAAE